MVGWRVNPAARAGETRTRDCADNVLPFWVVLQGDVARDPKRVREMHFWFAEYSAHLFFWSNSADAKAPISHFNKYLRNLLLP